MMHKECTNQMTVRLQCQKVHGFVFELCSLLSRLGYGEQPSQAGNITTGHSDKTKRPEVQSQNDVSHSVLSAQAEASIDIK